MQLGVGSWTYPWSIAMPDYPRPARPLGAFDLLGKAQAAGVSVV
jgi:hypothetical protein